MKTIAITGRSGSGKSTVRDHYARKGYPVLDADEIAREITQKGEPCLERLVRAFGEDILDEHGMLLRQILAARAFANKEKTEILNAITHPAIIARLLEQIEAAHDADEKIVFVDGAAIVGQAFEAYCDEIIVVTAPEKDAISRIVLRDGISKQAARERLDAQVPETVLLAAADYELVNKGTVNDLLKAADEVLEKLSVGEP